MSAQCAGRNSNSSTIKKSVLFCDGEGVQAFSPNDYLAVGKVEKMTHRIESVKPLNDLKLSVVFKNGVEKEYDLHILCGRFPQFKELEEDNDLFNKVKVDVGGYGISWDDSLDLDAEDIWEDGIEA